MAETGIILRRKDKADFSEANVVAGELVFALDTGEHGWKDKDGHLVWKDLNTSSKITLYSPGIPTPPPENH